MNNNSFDINVRTLDFHNRKIEINYVSSLCSDELIAYLVEGITNAKGKTLKDCLNNGDVKEETEISQYEYAMLTGCAIVKDIQENKNYVLPTIIGIVTITILGVGVFLIKKYVVNKK